ncbi:DUF3606 domain-containing protein [Mesorhizobium sp. M1060]|uniref:DUF3606 domain-containing protein n=1 Tax=unclassified Mesorhizobium TaxID=325217 RepID=UPI0003CE02A7|nr:DUF3606 domain-containing protein [Mesorhizobium sp. LSJC255A00]ESX20664.1 hypothetical protein X766_04770 [Mesorhizobium sp. LSJC255A00]
MADDKSKRDFRNRDRVSAEENYEVGFCNKGRHHTLAVKELIAKHGNQRETLKREAKALRK